MTMELLLFTLDRGYAGSAIAGGMGGIVVDWECHDKARRQAGQGTQVNHGTAADVAAMRHAVGDRVICRINNTPAARDAECKLAIENGASEVWLPMVRSPRELEECLRAIDGRARLGAMIETREAMRMGRELAQLPLTHAYVGLHDYRIDCGHAGLFDPIVDGTLDRFREDYPGALGVAGVTLPDRGVPIPQRLLLAAMVRLGCAFGVARRGFRADVEAPGVADAVAAIGAATRLLQSRSAVQTAADHAALTRAIAADSAGAASLHEPLLETACVS